MIKMGLDQSLTCSGYVIFDTDKNNIIANGIIEPKKTLPIEQRLGKIWTKLNDLYQRYEFGVLAFEDIQQQHGNVTTYKKLAMVYTTILLWCYFNEVKYQVFQASEWRSILSKNYNIKFGKKREDQKQAMKKFANDYFDVALSEDEADSLGIILAAHLDKKGSAF